METVDIDFLKLGCEARRLNDVRNEDIRMRYRICESEE